ncbi:YeiH family protein [Paenibacillus sp. sgz500992]|uniref:YeiH family protein n=1 Tax=Paenibacillus sp. sgz500992 TaxID=3242476 RepID=UPI0036D2287E
MNHAHQLQRLNDKYSGFILGILLTGLLAIAAKYLALLPYLGIMGQLVIAILLGVLLRTAGGVPQQAVPGISFSSKRLLRAGIILLGMRLNLFQLVQAGPKVLAIAVINIVFTLFTVYGLCKWMKIDRTLGLLTACGTAICGAAAVAAISPQLRASDNETAISAATVAVLGTIFTLVYTLIYPVLSLSPEGYGIFAGATLHEVAHVIAAAAPIGEKAADLAVIVKLTRVAMLVPAALAIGVWEAYRQCKAERECRGQVAAVQPPHSKIQWRKLPVPWFIGGFLLMSGVNTLGIIPKQVTADLIILAYMLLAMAMAGLGLGVDIKTFALMGKKPLLAGLIGSLLLSGLGFLLVHVLGLA